MQQPAHFVVGVDVSPHSTAAVSVAFEEAALRGAALRALYVWHPPLLGVLDEDAALRECRRVLSETFAGRTATHPEVDLHHEAIRGHPVRVRPKPRNTRSAWSWALAGTADSRACCWVR